MTFLRRFLIVALAAGVIVGTGWGLKHVDAINAYFQKDGSGEHAEGADGDHTPKAGETRNEDTATPSGARDDGATPADTKVGDTGTTAGDESEHPVGDDGKADDAADERWPALQFGDATHALQIMLPIIAAVVIIDQIRRRHRNSSPIPIQRF
jgi:hypothetical protein